MLLKLRSRYDDDEDDRDAMLYRNLPYLREDPYPGRYAHLPFDEIRDSGLHQSHHDDKHHPYR